MDMSGHCGFLWAWVSANETPFIVLVSGSVAHSDLRKQAEQEGSRDLSTEALRYHDLLRREALFDPVHRAVTKSH